MPIKLTFSKPYFIITTVLLLIEMFIALYVRDKIVRPYIGDFLAVILLYCLLRAFTSISILTAAITALVFAYMIEVLQYCNIVSLLGLQQSTITKVIIGTAFEWLDMVAYTAGIIIVLLIEKVWLMPSRN